MYPSVDDNDVSMTQAPPISASKPSSSSSSSLSALRKSRVVDNRTSRCTHPANGRCVHCVRLSVLAADFCFVLVAPDGFAGFFHPLFDTSLRRTNSLLYFSWCLLQIIHNHTAYPFVSPARSHSVLWVPRRYCARGAS